MNSIDRKKGPFINPRLYEIDRLGRDQFNQFVTQLTPVQLRQMEETHTEIKHMSRTLVGLGTVACLGSATLLRLTQYPGSMEQNIAFAVVSMFGAYAGAFGMYYESAAREGIKIINSRLKKPS